MNANIIDSYLVSLGFQVSQPEQRQFNNALQAARLQVKWASGNMYADLVKFQAGVIGVFGTITSSVIGLANHVAMSEQEFRLQGMRMGLTADAAKKLTIATDALGASLDDIAWDPELQKNFRENLELQSRLQENLGTDYADNMRAIRDLRQQYSLLKVSLQYLGMQFVNELFRQFGVTVDDVKLKMHQWVEWAQNNIPRIAAALADNVIPVMRQFFSLAENVGDALKQFAVLFANVVGLLSGDHSLQDTEFSFNKLATAISHVVGWLSSFVQNITLTEKLVGHFVNALALALGGDFKGAASEFKQGLQDLTGGTGGILGGVVGTGLGALGGAIAGAAGGPIGIVGGAVIGGVAGAATGYGIGQANQTFHPGAGSMDWRGIEESSAIRRPSDTIAAAREAAIRVAQRNGQDPNVIFAQWAHETGNFTNRGATNLNNLAGITDGRGNYQRFDSIDAFADYFDKHILNNKRYLNAGIRDAKGIDEYAAALKRGGYFEDSLANYQHGMHAADARYFGKGQQLQAPSQGTTITIGDIPINITQPGATPEQVRTEVRRGVQEAIANQTRMDLVHQGAY